ncbi:MAG: hypothetical protein AB7F65_05180 [Dehalococcoidia bacterium]
MPDHHGGHRDEGYHCAEHGRSFLTQDAYLAHRVEDHLDVPADADADTAEIRGQRDVQKDGETDVDPLAGVESAKSEQSDQAGDPDQRIVSSGQTEDHPARLEHDDPARRDVHRPPVPGPSRTDAG